MNRKFTGEHHDELSDVERLWKYPIFKQTEVAPSKYSGCCFVLSIPWPILDALHLAAECMATI